MMGASAKPTGLGSAKAPEPHSGSGPAGAIPSADDIMRFLRWKRRVFRDASATRATFGIRPALDHVIQEMILEELITEIERGDHHALQSERSGA